MINSDNELYLLKVSAVAADIFQCVSIILKQMNIFFFLCFFSFFMNAIIDCNNNLSEH